MVHDSDLSEIYFFGSYLALNFLKLALYFIKHKSRNSSFLSTLCVGGVCVNYWLKFDKLQNSMWFKLTDETQMLVYLTSTITCK